MATYATAARPYASAVYKLPSEKGTLPAWGDALDLLSAVVDNEDMTALLDQPEIVRDAKAELVLKVVGDKLDQPQQNLDTLYFQQSHPSIIFLLRLLIYFYALLSCNVLHHILKHISSHQQQTKRLYNKDLHC